MTDVIDAHFLNNVNLQNRLMMKGQKMGGVCSNLVVKGPKPLTHVQRLNGIKARVFLSNLVIRVLVALSPISGIKAAFTKPWVHGSGTNPNPAKVHRSMLGKTHKIIGKAHGKYSK